MNYLYNGIMAPTLPERDEEKYPYVIVGGSNPENPSPGSPIEMHAFSDPTLYQGALFSPYIKCEPSGNYFYAYVYEGEWKVHTPANTDVVSFTDNIRWTNVDLYNPDGTLFLAASDPIPVGTAPQLDPLSMWLGWKAGNWVARQRGKKKTPVAYLYNGVRLPDINTVWTDKETYPYATISPMTGYDGDYVLFLTDGTVYCVSAEDVDFTVVADAVNYVVYIFAKEESGNTWLYQQSGTTSDSDGVGMNSKPIWCNNAVLDIDGTVFLAASEPVPVYE